jgi:hypothetical protein
MKKIALSAFVVFLLLTACTRSFGPITPQPPTEEPTDEPQVLVTLSPPPTNTEVPKSDVITSTATQAATEEPTAAPPAGDATATQPAPTSAPTETPVNTPTITPTPFDPGEALGAPKFTDPMNESSFGNWARDNVMPDTDNIRLELEDGELAVTGKKLFFDTWWFSWPVVEDFYLEMVVETDTCTGKDAYGMIFRGPPRDFGDTFGYIVAFSCDGAFTLRRVDTADPYAPVDLIPWTQSPYIESGSDQTNVLAVQGIGDTFMVFANGVHVGQAKDNGYSRGRYGAFISPATTTNFTYRIDEITFWELE